MSLEASRLAGRGWEPGNCRDRSELHKAYEEHSQARLYSTVGGGGEGLLIGKYPKERTHRLSLGGSRAPSTRHKTPVSTSYRSCHLLETKGGAVLSTPKHTGTAFTSQGSISWRAAAQTPTRWAKLPRDGRLVFLCLRYTVTGAEVLPAPVP